MTTSRDSSRWRYVAPAGAPIEAGDLARWVASAFSSDDALTALRDVIQSRFNVRHCTLTSTGRAGMTLLLRALHRLSPNRTEVIVPAYTCYSVAASIVKAGLRPRPVDISPETLDYHPESLASTDAGRVLAVVATNLYGIPNDMPTLERFARLHGAFLIDDAAQAMGAAIDQRWSGTWGDAGLFSFDKGKNVSAIDGGAIVTNRDDVAAAVKLEMAGMRGPGGATAMMHLVKLMAYTLLLKPSLYWIPRSIPQLGLGTTVFTTDFPLDLPDRRLAALAKVMMGRLDSFTRARIRSATVLLESIDGRPGISTIAVRSGSRAVYLRLPILLATGRQRTEAIAALTGAGVGATGSYPASLVDVPELQPYLVDCDVRVPGARSVAQRITTLPTHPYVNDRDVQRMIEVLTTGTNAACAA